MRAGGCRQRRLCLLAAALTIACLVPANAQARKDRCIELSESSRLGPVPEASPLDPAATAMFAVLRRPAGAEDQVPVFNSLNENLGYELRSYFPAYLRQLTRDPGGDRYFLIVGFERSSPVLPPSCFPPRQRRLQAELVEAQRKREHTPVYCIEDVSAAQGHYGGSGCQPFAAVQSGARLIAQDESSTDVVELVPDGVAAVRLHYLQGNAVTSAVAGNAFTFIPPQRPLKEAQLKLRHLRRQIVGRFRAGRGHRLHLLRRFVKLARKIRKRLQPQNVEWIGPGGQVIRSFTPHVEALGGASFGGIFTASSTLIIR
jgi:hypothetical protein